MTKKITVGLSEQVKIITNDEKKKLMKAKIDTGATKCSIDIKLASKLKLGPIIKKRIVKSAHGIRLRPIILATVEFKGKKFTKQFTLANRSHLRFKVLIGVNILKHGFVVDPSKK